MDCVSWLRVTVLVPATSSYAKRELVWIGMLASNVVGSSNRSRSITRSSGASAGVVISSPEMLSPPESSRGDSSVRKSPESRRV